jgi:hypothetical protein
MPLTNRCAGLPTDTPSCLHVIVRCRRKEFDDERVMVEEAREWLDALLGEQALRCRPRLLSRQLRAQALRSGRTFWRPCRHRSAASCSGFALLSAVRTTLTAARVALQLRALLGADGQEELPAESSLHEVARVRVALRVSRQATPNRAGQVFLDMCRSLGVPEHKVCAAVLLSTDILARHPCHLAPLAPRPQPQPPVRCVRGEVHE